MPTDAEELATLRAAHSEVLAKKHEQKERIAALEAEVAMLNNDKIASAEMLHNVTVKQPLAKRAAAISHAPALFLDYLQRNYDVKPDENGKLLLCNKEDGKPVLVNKQPIDMLDGNAAWSFLTGGAQGAKNEQQKTFASIMRYAGATGGGATGGTRSIRESLRDTKEKEEKKVLPTVTFGLR